MRAPPERRRVICTAPFIDLCAVPHVFAADAFEAPAFGRDARAAVDGFEAARTRRARRR